MKEFDYVIIGGGCAGLSLAYELEINNKLKDKSLGLIENREKYERDKTWSFWKVFSHNFDDCVNYLKNFVKPVNSTRRNVSTTTTSYHGEDSETTKGGGKDPRNSGGGKVPEVADRYYRPAEWKLLVKHNLADKVLALRQKRKQKQKGKDPNKKVKIADVNTKETPPEPSS